MGCAGGTVGLLRGFNWSVDTLYVLLPICRVKWCRERRRTVGADAEWLEGQDLSVSPDEHCWCAGQVAAVLFLVEGC